LPFLHSIAEGKNLELNCDARGSGRRLVEKAIKDLGVDPEKIQPQII
jgi:hypothetical protein